MATTEPLYLYRLGWMQLEDGTFPRTGIVRSYAEQGGTELQAYGLDGEPTTVTISAAAPGRIPEFQLTVRQAWVDAGAGPKRVNAEIVSESWAQADELVSAAQQASLAAQSAQAAAQDAASIAAAAGMSTLAIKAEVMASVVDPDTGMVRAELLPGAAATASTDYAAIVTN